MQSVLSIAIAASLICLATAQDVSGPAGKIPTCEKSCMSSIFTKMSCAQNDWKCFCSVKSGTTGGSIWGGRQTTECSTAFTSCSHSDILTTAQSLTSICQIMDADLISSAASIAASASAVAASLDSADAASATAAAASVAVTSASGNGTDAAAAATDAAPTDGMSNTTATSMASAAASSDAGASAAAVSSNSMVTSMASASASAAAASGSAQASSSRAAADVARPESLGALAFIGAALIAFVA